MDKKIILTIIAVLAIAGLIWWFAAGRKSVTPTAPNPPTAAGASTTEPTSLGAAIYAPVESVKQQATQAIPDTNPIKNANPYEGAYKNPFAR